MLGVVGSFRKAETSDSESVSTTLWVPRVVDP